MARGKEKTGEEPGIISKSQRKREAQELKSLAAELIGLSKARLERVPMEDSIREAVEEARLIRSHVARKRQLQFIAKLLRRTEMRRDNSPRASTAARPGGTSCWNPGIQHWGSYWTSDSKPTPRPCAN